MGNSSYQANGFLNAHFCRKQLETKPTYPQSNSFSAGNFLEKSLTINKSFSNSGNNKSIKRCKQMCRRFHPVLPHSRVFYIHLFSLESKFSGAKLSLNLA